MATQAEDKVQVLIAGKMHDDWQNYSTDSDLMVPADAWNVSVGLDGGKLPADVFEGQQIEIRVGDDVVLTGRIDDVADSVDKHSHTLSLSGRDGAAILVDCSAPIFVARQVDLAGVVAKVVRPLGITKIRIDAAKTYTLDKVNVEPGDSAWAVLQNAAEANGLWPWFEPDGTLVVGGPDYTAPDVADLVMRTSGKGNNMLSLSRRRSIHSRYSQVTVLGQTHGTVLQGGANAITQTEKDTGVSWYRPRVVVDHECDNNSIALARARKLIADGRVAGFALNAKVKGHRINAPGKPGHGKLWQPGQRVRVMSEPHGIDDIFFLIARTFAGGREIGATTDMKLIEDGAWVLDAHPHKGKHRRGKSSAPDQIIDLTGVPT